MDLRLLILLLFTLTSAQNSPRDYFKNCLVFKDQSGQQSFKAPAAVASSAIGSAQKTEKKRPCRSYQCLMQSETLDLEKLKFFQCTSDYECANDVSGMICSNHSIASEQKYCSCPYGYAYSTQNCRCQRAELCWSNKDPCHKGMKCQDQKCSCRNLENVLYEIHGGFCVEHRSTHLGMDHLALVSPADDQQPQQGPEIIVVAVLAAVVILGLIFIGFYALSVRRKDIDLCSRGDYVCDDIVPGNRQNQPHVAAWDAPGMDFLSEEQTLKYLNRSNSTAENNLKSPSVATTAELVDEAPSPSGSLPECEQNQRIIVGKLSESSFNNPTFNASSRHSSESKDNNQEDLLHPEDQDQVTKASNIL